jgi:hypothetical protein
MSTQHHVPWGSIELLHNVVRALAHLQTLGHALPRVEYRAKVKLHGTNCAIQTHEAGLVAQSRTALLSPGVDNKGFAAWVHAHEHYFSALDPGLVVFGEWCGPGVEKGMAVSRAPSKVFAVFAIRIGDRLVHAPNDIRTLLPTEGAPSSLYVLPWEGEAVTIDFASRDGVEEAAAALNEHVAQVEREDPWVKRELGVSGIGEGLVFYPVLVDGAIPDLETLQLLIFKAKGEKHRSAGTKQAVQVDASVVATIDDFVTLMVTEARLQQGLVEGAGGARTPRLTGAFLAWVLADVRKESVAELEASSLSWAQVEKAVQARARAWFLADPKETR